MPRNWRFSMAAPCGRIWNEARMNSREIILSANTSNEEAYIRTKDFKFVYCTGLRARSEGYVTDNPTPGRYVRVYDLRQDPGEFHDISASQPERVKAFQQMLLQRFRQTDPNTAQEPHASHLEEILDWYLRP